VVKHDTSLYQQWLQEKAIKELCIYKDGAKHLVLRHQVASALKPRLWLDKPHPVLTAGIGLPGLRLGIYYG
jgi:hypothetical protein